MFRRLRETGTTLCALTIVTIALPAAADGGAAFAVALARSEYHEGVPASAARELDDAGVARLAEMLGDSGQAKHHAQIVAILGMSGHPRAYDAIAGAAAETPEGEVGRAVLRKQVALRAALGRLARHDDRALAALLSAARAGEPTPAWSCGRQRGERLGALLRRSTLTGLALSGRPEARTLLRRLRRGAPR